MLQMNDENYGYEALTFMFLGEPHLRYIQFTQKLEASVPTKR